MPAGQGGRQGGGSGSSQGQPRGGSRKREPKGSSHAKPGAPTQKAYVATPADRKGTRSITEYFVRRGPLSPRSDGSVFTASEGGTSSRAPSRQGDAPQTSSTSTSTLNADQGDVLSAVVRAAGEAVHSAAQMLTGGLSHLLSHYGSGSDDEGQNGQTTEHVIDVDAASASVEAERMQALRDKWTASVFINNKETTLFTQASCTSSIMHTQKRCLSSRPSASARKGPFAAAGTVTISSSWTSHAPSATAASA